MIYSKSFKYIINPEKLKGFIDYLYIFTQKVRMQETNLSFEYGLEGKDKIVILQRWSTRNDYEQFIKQPEFDNELKTLEKMAKKTEILFDLDLER
ncbi:antibiotic biosynthesis monooxygenase [Mycoplasmopsis edwardii]|uniref:Antibiotic biosynthesis monooxygenase n=2 Tax=Mycoplasmopsis edwardii TaxID=53558 RepID=A0ACD4PHV8_9BACT|nr:antibiotic biosynthesis monooxygenase [Mycoplasmopsis edwardii]WBP84254.1 antibiotic biosynthesis monooxygenase [Mycoplasmopsis edwardii]